MPDIPSAHHPVTLADLRALGSLEVRGAAGTEIDDVTHDSRTVGPRTLFACRPGLTADGHDFAPEAVRRGAAALLVERILDIDVPQVRVDSVARALGPVSARVHGHPSRDLTTVGVTGTNGKTTTAHLLEAAFRASGAKSGLIGTVETRVGGRTLEGVRTTPESTDLQRLLRRMADEAVTAVAMEVSSHGLSLGRVRGTHFSAAIFTNLTQDHLDFHRDMEEYFEAKASLFAPEYADLGVVNIDDPYGRRLVERASIDVVTVSPSGEVPADVRADDVEAGPRGTDLLACLRGGSVPVRTGLVGDFTVANVLGALAALEAVGIDRDDAAAGIAALKGVPGRMERVEAGQAFTVLVDYAHTPDSVDHVLATARKLTRGRVIVVLGSGGDRDRGKRPLMGHAAAAGGDLAIFTSDNPRSEDPLAIIGDMAAGAEGAGAYETCPDRREAIRRAVTTAGEDDVVLVVGKGHEQTQEVAGVHHPFDDREVAHDLLKGGA